MASYKILHREDGKFAVEVDEGKEKPIVSGPYDTETAANAYINEQRRMAAAGERWAQTKLGSWLDRD